MIGRDDEIGRYHDYVNQLKEEVNQLVHSRSYRYTKIPRLIYSNLYKYCNLIKNTFLLLRVIGFQNFSLLIYEKLRYGNLRSINSRLNNRIQIENLKYHNKKNKNTDYYGDLYLKSVDIEKIKNYPNFIDIIIPVYKNYNITIECINSALNAKNKIKIRLIIINDKSPDDELTNELRNLSKNNKNIILLENDENYGFVKTVNIGMRYFGNSDVILLNSDTLVADNWVDRLYAHSLINKKCGTITPFSNNATICSFPDINGVKDTPHNLNLTKTNDAFYSANAQKSIELPTAVGFCMYIKRECLAQVGEFDEDTFGKGYGEENDFCLRAALKGWTHLLAADVYVKHVGEVSFSENSESGKKRAMDILNSMYPSYAAEVAIHVEKNQILPLKVAALRELMKYKLQGSILVIRHMYEGGTAKYWNDLEGGLNGEYGFIYLASTHDQSVVELYVNICGTKFTLYSGAPSYDGFLGELIKSYEIKFIHINHMLGHGKELINFILINKFKYILTLHDYNYICPQNNLLRKGKFCNGPAESKCINCVELKARIKNYNEWFYLYDQLFKNADKIIAPSGDVGNRYKERYKGLEYHLIPHENIELGDYSKEEIKNKKIIICLIGDIAEHKGYYFLQEILKYINSNRLNIEIHVIGKTFDNISMDNLKIHGEYSNSELQKNIGDINPNVILYLSTWPETYSYTLSEGIVSGRLIYAPKIGAFIERAKNNDLIKLYLSGEPVDILIPKIIKDPDLEFYRIFKNPIITFNSATKKIYESVNNLSKSKKITVNILPEVYGDIKSPCAYIRLILPYLKSKGMENFLINIVDKDNIFIGNPSILVMHRISFGEVDVDYIINNCVNNNIKILYDIDDDLICIGNSNHSESEFYKKFESKIEKIIKNSSLVTVSTGVLGKKLETLNSNIQLVENRLSRDLWNINRSSVAEEKKVTRFVYMGTQTHKEDLAILIDAIKVMKEKYGESIEFYIIGITADRNHRDIINYLDQTEDAFKGYPNFVNWFLDVNNFDVGLCPLVSNKFNEAKSSIKFMDYTAAGIATIASNALPYKNDIEDNINGILCSTTREWISGMELMMDVDFRKKLLANALIKLENKWIIENSDIYSSILKNII